VIVLVGLLMPALILFLALVVQIANWYTHKRHLQVQVDAAALAAGQLFSDCLRSSGGTVETSMENLAAQYGGSSGTPLYNEQVGGSSGKGALTLNYQRNSYPAPNSTPSDTDVPEGQDACTSGLFDVKATEAAIPHIFNIGLKSVNVHAHARVELRLLTEMTGLLPVAVPDTRFNYAFVTFIDEATGATIAGPTQMAQSGVNAKGQQLWITSSPPSFQISARDIGVRIRLVAGNDPNLPCGQLYAECYTDPTAGNEGIVHIRGWTAAGGALAPVELHNAWLLPGTCSPHAYFTTVACSAGIQAEVNFGDRPVSGAGITASVTATIAGGGTVNLTRGAAVAGTTFTWTAAGGLGVSGPGGFPVTMGYSWEQTSGTWRGNACTTRGSNPCKSSGPLDGGGTVQRPYQGSLDLSGPVQQIDVFEPGVSTSGANSFQQGTTHTLGVAVATTGTLRTQAAATDPVIFLRVTGSRNQSIDCDPDISNLADELAQGCGPTYAINSGFSCPGYNELWGSPQPWTCVKTQTGGAVGQVERGMKDRILGGASTCTAPINWPNYTVDDRRIVPLIITPFGSFSGSGNAIIPVIDFGAFYVMGWNGDPCPGAVSVPKGYIAGHFIKYIPRNPKGSGDARCSLADPTKLTPCAAVMTR
jgi:Putative Flp pilus-assembly TadE/G-like